MDVPLLSLSPLGTLKSIAESPKRTHASMITCRPHSAVQTGSTPPRTHAQGPSIPKPQSLQFLVALPLRPPAPGSTPLPLLPSSASHPPRRPPLDCRGGPSGFALFPSSFRSAPPSVRIELAWLARINPLTPSSCFPERFMPMPLLSLMF